MNHASSPDRTAPKPGKFMAPAKSSIRKSAWSAAVLHRFSLTTTQTTPTVDPHLILLLGVSLALGCFPPLLLYHHES